MAAKKTLSKQGDIVTPKKPEVITNAVRKIQLPIFTLKMVTTQPFLWVFLAALLGILLAVSLNASFMVLPSSISPIDFLKSKPSLATTAAQLKEATKAAVPTPSPKPSTSIIIPQNVGRFLRVPILTYHYIGNNPNPADKTRDNLSVAPDIFEAQMKYLVQNGYNTISLDTLYAALKDNVTLPPKPIILTFDDGYIDFYVNAFPILRQYDLHATSFIPTGLMDQGYYLHWSQIKEMDSTGLISFQAHSVNHPNLVALSDDQLKYQLIESKKKLEAELGKPVNFMAYPFGISDTRVWQTAQSAGYLGSVGTWFGEIESEGNLMDMPRVKISGAINITDFPKRF